MCVSTRFIGPFGITVSVVVWLDKFIFRCSFRYLLLFSIINKVTEFLKFDNLIYKYKDRDVELILYLESAECSLCNANFERIISFIWLFGEELMTLQMQKFIT